MKKITLCIFIFFSLFSAFSRDVDTILKKVDNNEVYSSIYFRGEMIIKIGCQTFTKQFSVYAREDEDYFMEFNNPDDEGTRYLKTKGNLYVYTEDLEEIMPITGHMLKESLMGSDLSYEDMTGNTELRELYDAKIKEEATIEGRTCWVIELTAKNKQAAYPTQRIWISQDTFELKKAEYYTLSGAKIKEYRVIKSELINGKYFPTEQEFRDMLRKDTVTVFRLKDIEMDVKFPGGIFTLRNLSK